MRPNSPFTFWGNVAIGKIGECWLWRKGVDKDGYGQATLKSVSVTESRSHRIAWVLTHGRPVPKGMQVLHRCDNPGCCNPGHLFLGTCADNMADKSRKGRVRVYRGESHANAKLTKEQVMEMRSSSETNSALALRFGVSEGTIQGIVSRKRWRWLP